MGLYYTLGAQWTNLNSATVNTFGDLNAADDIAAYIGRVYIDGRPGSTKTISAAGGGSITIHTGTPVTFANGSTSVTVGIQDVSTTAGAPARPDGSFDVQSAALVGGGGALAANTWTTITMTGGSGSKTLTQGDLIAVVVHMTARGGADAVNLRPGMSHGGQVYQTPLCTSAAGGVWTNAGRMPNILITFDDATTAILDMSWPYSGVGGTEVFSDSTNPDERGLVFQLPWSCNVDALFTRFLTGGADAGFSINLYSDPLSSPSLLATRSLDSDQHASTANNLFATFPLASAVTLQNGVDYCLAVRATGANNVTLTNVTLADEDYRTFLPGGTSLAKATRDGGSGAFTLESPAVTLIQVGVRISALVGA
jgi:hypothetical protein